MMLDDLERLIDLLRRTGVVEYRDREVSMVLGPAPLPLAPSTPVATKEEPEW